jgi:hypothetical protein
VVAAQIAKSRYRICNSHINFSKLNCSPIRVDNTLEHYKDAPITYLASGLGCSSGAGSWVVARTLLAGGFPASIESGLGACAVSVETILKGFSP